MTPAERSRLALQERVHGMGWVLMTPEQREAETTPQMPDQSTDEDVRAGEAALEREMVADILETPIEELRAEIREEGGDPDAILAEMRRRLEAAQREVGATPSGYIRADDVAGLAGALLAALPSDASTCKWREEVGWAMLNESIAHHNAMHLPASRFYELRAALRALSGGQHG